MKDDLQSRASEPARATRPAIRFLAESALRSLTATGREDGPRSRGDAVALLGEALMSSAEADHQSVVASLIANGVSTKEMHHFYIPEASRYLGDKWVRDEASFVEVTIGGSRLQALIQRQHDQADDQRVLDRRLPLGQSVLMVVPRFEQHSLGAVVAADDLRRRGLWVRMAIGLNRAEIARLIRNNRFSMIGISVATWKSVEKSTGLIDYIRSNVAGMPPIVIGGRVIEERSKARRCSGADFAVKSSREAVERCGLKTASESGGSGVASRAQC